MSGRAASAVVLDHVWKRYRLGSSSRLLGRRAPADAPRELWSLREVSLEVAPGESVGLIGHNGAGKSTTLKLLAGITRPTRGRVHTRGRLASLINLGAGFHRELTGRENIFLNGVILGLSRREVRARFDEIVAFAELGPYLDTPLKRYSTGMYARLGFAVAAHVEPDVLLVDEVLSVGDVAFQDRSIRKMLSFRERGCSVLFVSHNLSAVELMCQRAVWLDHGRVRRHGPTAEVVRAYLDALDRELVAGAGDELRPDQPDEPLLIEEASVHDLDGRPCTEFDHGDGFLVRLRCAARADLADPGLVVSVRGDYGPLFSASLDGASAPTGWRRGRHLVECVFETLPVLPGLYRVEAQPRPAHGEAAPPRTLAAFRVGTDLEAFGSRSLVGATKSRGGFLMVPYTWRITTAEGVRELPGLRRPRR